MKIDKHYTVRFTYAGVEQFVKFFEKDGKIQNPTLHISYWRGELPSLTGLDTIDDIINSLKEKLPNIKIHLINGVPIWYYNNNVVQKAVDEFCTNIESSIIQQCKLIFENILFPLMQENRWYFSTSHIGIPVLVEKSEEGEWQNIEDKEKEEQFEFICEQSIGTYNSSKYPIASLIGYLGTDYLKEKNLWVEIE